MAVTVPHSSRRARIRVVIADDHPIDREGIAALLGQQRDLEVVGKAATARQLIAVCRRTRPDVCIVDSCMSGPGGRPLMPLLRATFPGVRAVVIAHRSQSRCVVLNPPHREHFRIMQSRHTPAMDCLQVAVMQGALGAVRRNADVTDLLRAVRTVAKGGSWLDSATASVLSRIGNGRADAQPALTRREGDVALQIAEGSCNKDIARALRITESTVKKHVSSLLRKLGADQRLQIGLQVARNPQLFPEPAAGRRGRAGGD